MTKEEFKQLEHLINKLDNYYSTLSSADFNRMRVNSPQASLNEMIGYFEDCKDVVYKTCV